MLPVSPLYSSAISIQREAEESRPRLQKQLRIQSKLGIAAALWIIGGLALVLLSLTVSNYFIVPLLLLFASIGFYASNLRCPNCAKPVLYNPVRIFGKSVYVWGVFVPQQCTDCGTRLDS